MARPPARREHVVDEGGFPLVVRAGQPERLVKQQQEAVGVIQGQAVDPHVRGVDLARGVDEGGRVGRGSEGDGVGPQKIAGLAA